MLHKKEKYVEILNINTEKKVHILLEKYAINFKKIKLIN